jgi:hypothetical protein
MNVMEFFQQSAGQWQSQRTTHHLAFRRDEKGASEIHVEAFAADHPQIIALCEMHEVDPKLAIGGAYVSWSGSMSWDRDTEGPHEGETVFALVPDVEDPSKGRLLRERGYAEVVPVVGRYEIDEEDRLVLTTEYDTMSTLERFWFVSPDMRMRTSTVKRFGGFSSTTFCTETRKGASLNLYPNVEDSSEPLTPHRAQTALETRQFQSVFGW